MIEQEPRGAPLHGRMMTIASNAASSGGSPSTLSLRHRGRRRRDRSSRKRVSIGATQLAARTCNCAPRPRRRNCHTASGEHRRNGFDCPPMDPVSADANHGPSSLSTAGLVSRRLRVEQQREAFGRLSRCHRQPLATCRPRSRARSISGVSASVTMSNTHRRRHAIEPAAGSSRPGIRAA